MTSNLMDWFLGVLATPHYLASPENRWDEMILPFTERWWTIPGPADQLRWAYVGSPPGYGAVWQIWIEPLFWWISFLGSMFLVAVCVTVILRRQWVDNERLPFPLVQLPIDLTESSGGKPGLPDMLRNKLFWVGAAIPLGIIVWNIGGYFVPGFPVIPGLQSSTLIIAKHFTSLFVKVNFYVIGFAYLVNTEILLSVWVFYLLGWIQTGIFDRLGISIGSELDYHGSHGVIASWVGFGAMLVLVIVGLWMARAHLSQVWQKIRDPKHPLDDSKELLPYRWAAMGLVVGLAYAFSFFIHQGMTWSLSLLFLAATMVLHLGITKIIAQTGLIYVRGPLSANLFAMNVIGSAALPPAALVAIGAQYAIISHNKGLFLPGVFHVGRLATAISRWGRQVLIVMVIATGVGLVVGVAMNVFNSYEFGSTTFGGVPYPRRGADSFEVAVKQMDHPMTADLARFAALGAGALLMTIFTVVHYRIPWWPLHPIGFPVYATWTSMITFMSIFLVWLAKTALLRMGGMALHERAKPFFVGLLCAWRSPVIPRRCILVSRCRQRA
jgi:hypothetical protein